MRAVSSLLPANDGAPPVQDADDGSELVLREFKNLPETLDFLWGDFVRPGCHYQ